MSQCRSCDAEVIFVRNMKSGKTVILNATPERRYVLLDAARYDEGDPPHVAGYPIDVATRRTEAVLVPTFVDHHVTCTHAAEWKR